jgi:hypothetical protein
MSRGYLAKCNQFMYMFSNLYNSLDAGKTCTAMFGPFLKIHGHFLVAPARQKLSTAIQKITTLIESGRDYSNLAPFSPLEQGIWRWQGQL